MKIQIMFVSLLLLLALLFSSCSAPVTQPAVPSSPATVQETVSNTPSPTTRATRKIYPTHTQTLTWTPLPPTVTAAPSPVSEGTSTPIIHTLTPGPGSLVYMKSFPTWNFNHIQTATRAPAQACPQATPGPVNTPVFTAHPVFFQGDPIPSTDKEILAFLNTYGVEPLVGKNAVPGGRSYPGYVVAYQDFTNDGIPEIILLHKASLWIFGCNAGEYQLLITIDWSGYKEPPKILLIADLNHNGISEIYMQTGTTTQAGRDFDGIEWDGTEFKWLLTYPYGDHGVNVAPGYLIFEDVDHDGMKEVVAVSGIPVWEMYPSGLPWRKAKKIFKWNGDTFMFYREILDPPVFRFQAIQDADLAVLAGEHDRALDLYRQAIFSDQLKWFSKDRRNAMAEQWTMQLWGSPTPSLPAPDLLEYDNLAAYAAYRIMLLHVAHGYVSDAQVVYDGLQKKYPPGKAGFLYAAMATEFWTEYSTTKSMAQACAKALIFAQQHWSDVTQYLGNTNENHDYFGWQSVYYDESGNMLCPFQ